MDDEEKSTSSFTNDKAETFLENVDVELKLVKTLFQKKTLEIESMKEKVFIHSITIKKIF